MPLMPSANTTNSFGEFARLALCAGCVLAGVSSLPRADATEAMVWEKLPAIPDAEGFAGAFAGVSGGALIVAGGANIAGDKWAEPLRKQWYDSVFVLEKPDGTWRGGFRLPRPLGYGVSVTTERGIVCIGGSDSQRHYADVFLLEWRGGSIVTTALPALPKPCANACGGQRGCHFAMDVPRLLPLPLQNETPRPPAPARTRRGHAHTVSRGWLAQSRGRRKAVRASARE